MSRFLSLLAVVLSLYAGSAAAFTAGTYTLSVMGQTFSGSDPLAICSSPAVGSVLLGYNGGIPNTFTATGDASTVDCFAVFPAWSSVPISFKSLSANFSFVAAPADPASGVPAVAAVSSVSAADVAAIVAGLAAVNSSVAAANPQGLLSGYPVNDVLLAFALVIIWALGLQSGMHR
ncbi:MAG: hypothetical protein WC710_07685 [Gallionella sp.]